MLDNVISVSFYTVLKYCYGVGSSGYRNVYIGYQDLYSPHDEFYIKLRG